MVIKPICVRVVCDLFGSNITLESWLVFGYYYQYTRLTAFFQDNLGKPAPER